MLNTKPELADKMHMLLKAIVEKGPPEGDYDGRSYNTCCYDPNGDHKPDCRFVQAEALVKEASIQ